MAIKEIYVTPEMATQYLNKNKHNRKLSLKRSQYLANSMLRGEWQFNGDTIRISRTGRLLDGQHRLKAIELSGIPQKFVLVDGLEDEVFTTIDTGLSRDASQMLAINGESYSSILAATAKSHLTYEKTGRPIHGNSEKKPTHTQVVLFCEQCDEMKESVAFVGKNTWLKRYLTASIAAFCHYEFGFVDKQIRDKFFNELINGEFSYHDSPVRYIRDMFIEERGLPSTPDKSRKIALIFKAFNLYRKSKSVKLIRLPKDQSEWYLL